MVRALAAHGSERARADGGIGDVHRRRHAGRRLVEALMVSMTERRIRHLPVVDDAGVLTDIVSIGDVVKARLGQLETENQALFEYLHQGR